MHCCPWGRQARVAAALLGLVGAGGCTSWTIARGPTPEAVAYARARSGTSRPIRVEVTSGELIMLTNASIVGDTIVGLVWTGRNSPPALRPIALNDIENVEYRASDRQVGAVGIAAAASMAVTIALVTLLALIMSGADF